MEEELERLGITSDYRVSLEWESTADLDIYVVNDDTDEMISYRNKPQQKYVLHQALWLRQ